jgi:hypothetical protein
MKKHTKMIRGFQVTVERLSTTDLQITVNGNPVLIQTHNFETFFILIEQCMIEERHKQGTLFP